MNKTEVAELTPHCWFIPCREDEEYFNIRNKIDEILIGYSFYLEREWEEYNAYPSEGYEEIYGAWRDHIGTNFLFLLDNRSFDKKEKSFLLSIKGKDEEIDRINNKIEEVKLDVYTSEAKEKVNNRSIKNLEGIKKTKAFNSLLTLISVLTGAFNVLSFYLRKIPKPEFDFEMFEVLYSCLLIIVHLASLLLFLVLIALVALVIYKYGRIILKRL